MHLELIPSYTITPKELELAQSYCCGKLDRLCLPGTLISALNLNGYESLGCLIDFPFGMSTLDSKKRECFFALSHTKHLDVVISRYYIINGMYEKIIKELQAIQKYVAPKGGIIRCMFDFNLCSLDQLKNIIELISYVGITKICISTGILPYDFAELKLVIGYIQKISTLEVYCGPVWTHNQYNELSKNPQIAGLFFNSVQSYKKILKT